MSEKFEMALDYFEKAIISSTTALNKITDESVNC